MRGVAGGAILGVPLLYTQETWLEGSSVSPAVILTGLVVVLGLNVALSYFVGFRRGRTQRPTEDAVVGMGLSILLAAILLVLLDRVGPGTSPENALGMIALLTIPVSVGFSIGAALAPQGGGDQRVASDGATQGPVIETLLAYAVAFAVSAAMLAMFGRLDAVDGATAGIVVTLAFPTSIGAALGRLLV